MLIKKLSLSKKIALIFSLVIVLPMALTSLLFVKMEHERVQERAKDRIMYASSLVERSFESVRQATQLETRFLVSHAPIREAIARRDLSQLVSELEKLEKRQGIDFVAIVSNEKKVLFLNSHSFQHSREWEDILIGGLEGREERTLWQEGSSLLLQRAELANEYEISKPLAFLFVGKTIDSSSLDHILRTTGVEVSLVYENKIQMTTLFDEFGQKRIVGKELIFPQNKPSDDPVLFSPREQENFFSFVRPHKAPYEKIKTVFFMPEALIQEKSSAWQFLIIFVLSLGLALLAAGLISKEIIKPIQSLRDGTKRVSEGQFRQLISVDKEDEIGELTHSFNGMILQLRENFKKIRAMHTLGTEISQLFEKEEMIVSALKNICLLASADRAYLKLQTQGGNHINFVEPSLHPDSSNPSSHEFTENSHSIVLSLKYGDTELGQCQLVRRPDQPPFQEIDHYVVEAIAQSVTMQLKNSDLVNEMQEKMRIEQELISERTISSLRERAARLEELGRFTVRLTDKINSPLQVIALATEEMREGDTEARDHLLSLIECQLGKVQAELETLSQYKQFAPENSLSEELEPIKS